jgi:hypothetical protein
MGGEGGRCAGGSGDEPPPTSSFHSPKGGTQRGPFGGSGLVDGTALAHWTRFDRGDVPSFLRGRDPIRGGPRVGAVRPNIAPKGRAGPGTGCRAGSAGPTGGSDATGRHVPHAARSPMRHVPHRPLSLVGQGESGLRSGVAAIPQLQNACLCLAFNKATLCCVRHVPYVARLPFGTSPFGTSLCETSRLPSGTSPSQDIPQEARP